MLIDKDGNINLKLIMWACTTDKIDPNIPQYPIYHNNPKRNRNPETKKIRLENEEQRYKNEYY